MKLTFNSAVQNQFFNVYRINQSAARKSGKAGDSLAEKRDEPETKQEIENKRLANVLDSSMELQKTEMVSSVKARVDGEARVLKSEIELDKLHDPSEETSKELIMGKEGRLADLEQKSNELLSYIGKITGETTEIDDFREAELMADYSRLQGGYLSDAVFGILDLKSAENVYDECLANGMTEEEASAKFQEKLEERLGHFQEALALALEFVPLDEDATGEPISYSDVYDENGQLKVPVKLTFEEYHRNLQSILENMMNALKDRKDDFPNLYKIYFGV